MAKMNIVRLLTALFAHHSLSLQKFLEKMSLFMVISAKKLCMCLRVDRHQIFSQSVS